MEIYIMDAHQHICSRFHCSFSVRAVAVPARVLPLSDPDCYVPLFVCVWYMDGGVMGFPSTVWFCLNATHKCMYGQCKCKLVWTYSCSCYSFVDLCVCVYLCVNILCAMIFRLPCKMSFVVMADIFHNPIHLITAAGSDTTDAAHPICHCHYD